jgi:hypothetical protein
MLGGLSDVDWTGKEDAVDTRSADQQAMAFLLSPFQRVRMSGGVCD